MEKIENSEINQNGYEKFDSVSEEERNERIENLSNVLDRESSFSSFWSNVYKYTDKFNVGTDDKIKKREIFAEASDGIDLLRSVLEYFEDGSSLPVVASNKGGRFVSFNDKSDLIGLDVNKLPKMFKWTLDSFVDGGDKIGRNVDINKDDIEKLVSDMEEILKKVDKMLKEKE